MKIYTVFALTAVIMFTTGWCGCSSTSLDCTRGGGSARGITQTASVASAAESITTEAELATYLTTHSPFVGRWKWRNMSGKMTLTFEEVGGIVVGTLRGTTTTYEEFVTTVTVEGLTRKVEFTAEESPWTLELGRDGSLKGTERYQGRYIVKINLKPTIP